MKDQNKCDKYEALFVFKGDDALYNHIENCPDCFEEHKKQLKVSALVKEVAPVYLQKQKKKRLSLVKKLACCFMFVVFVSAFTGYKMYEQNSFQVSSAEESYISAMGLPTDDYGFFEF